MALETWSDHNGTPWAQFDEVAAPGSIVDLKAILRDREKPLPYSLRMVLENLLRGSANAPERLEEAHAVAAWHGGQPLQATLDVSRVIMPDSSGLPALMDLASARDVFADRGLPTEAVEPQIPVDMVVDHSLIVDVAGNAEAARINVAHEYARNKERYSFFKWAERAFERLRVAPPGMGIIHQIHLEKLARLVVRHEHAEMGTVVGPEFVLGCDSHTPMVNGMGLLAWGVGGIDAEAALLGEPHLVRISRVVGVRFRNRLAAGATATDLVLTVTERLRQAGVVGAFVEFFGPGLETLSVADRATIANMAPEYGATIGYFPIDRSTIAYLRQSGREDDHVALVERYARAAGLFREDSEPEPAFDEIVDIDLACISPSVAGPKRPQDRHGLSDVGKAFRASLTQPAGPQGFGLGPDALDASAAVAFGERTRTLHHGSVLIAAITSCTNTSNPDVMIAAGLLARNAVARGLTVQPGIKTSLAPGSRLVRDYLDAAGLLASLEALGFHVVGFGCTTCSGKSGPLDPSIEAAVNEAKLVGAAVLSGNRNFEGRIHPLVGAAYLASPPLVVAYALAGRVDSDLQKDPIGHDRQGNDVYLLDIWPAHTEIADLAGKVLAPAQFRQSYATLFEGTDLWDRLEAHSGPRFPWRPDSEYVKRPPFFDVGRSQVPDTLGGARALAVFGDSLTTDHITPSGAISPTSVAGQYLASKGIAKKDFNAVTQRRGNHEFMARVTFGNSRLQNRLCPGQAGAFTRLGVNAEPMPIYDAAQVYRANDVPMIIVAGRDYGMGSSRDWAAKGPKLLGIKAVLAVSFERIHRSNLIGMGIVPLVFEPGDHLEKLQLTGFERFTFAGLHRAIAEGAPVDASATPAEGGPARRFRVFVDVANEAERRLLLEGGMFPKVLNRMTASAEGAAEVK